MVLTEYRTVVINLLFPLSSVIKSRWNFIFSFVFSIKVKDVTGTLTLYSILKISFVKYVCYYERKILLDLFPSGVLIRQEDGDNSDQLHRLHFNTQLNYN